MYVAGKSLFDNIESLGVFPYRVCALSGNKGKVTFMDLNIKTIPC